MMHLEIFKDAHANQRAFIACSGPSLNTVPVKKLNGEIVFALNRGYLKLLSSNHCFLAVI
jgi:hypothetical protein